MSRWNHVVRPSGWSIYNIMTIAPFSQGSLQRPIWLVPSTWIEHAPFAFLFVETHRPRCVTELGTFLGFSYFCFCQEIQRVGIEVKCFAIDTWKRDEHEGFYGEEVFDHIRRYHDSQYSGFSQLIRPTFD
jgi:hypothetical protein